MGLVIEWFSPSVGTPIVSIAEYGIVFNKAAIAALGNPPFIRMGFDRKNKYIIIDAVSEGRDESDAIPFAERERVGYVRINNRDFVRFVLRYCPDIKLDKARRFLSRLEESYLVVDLNSPADYDSDDDNM